MKVALCFIINYNHVLHKEAIWREWIEPNKDIINVYFYYKDIKLIKSPWILEHTIPPDHIYETSYFYVIPAYLSVLNFAAVNDTTNIWFCLLTESCCPIISPKRFRYLFYKYHKKTIMNWRKAWWNTTIHKRANLALIPQSLHLANDPWFVLKRENVNHILNFVNNQKKLSETIITGGLANESLFAISLFFYKQLENVIASATHLTDWSRMNSSTSPHVFKEANQMDIQVIEKNLNENKFVMFIRKVSSDFPDEVLKNYIYNYSKEKDDMIVLRDPFIMQKIFRVLRYFWRPDIFLVPFVMYFAYLYMKVFVYKNF
jgi:hypothetical protein